MSAAAAVERNRERCIAKWRLSPGFARFHFAVLAGAFFDDIDEQRADVLRDPAQTQRHVKRVHAEVPHAAVFTVETDHALQLMGLLGSRSDEW